MLRFIGSRKHTPTYHQQINELLGKKKKYSKIVKEILKTIAFILNFIPREWTIWLYEMLLNFQLQKEQFFQGSI